MYDIFQLLLGYSRIITGFRCENRLQYKKSFISFVKGAILHPHLLLCTKIREFADSFSFHPILQPGDSMARILMSSLGVH